MRPALVPTDCLPGLTDTHCHLEDSAFDPDRLAVLDRARQAGLVRLLLAGTDVTDSRAAAQCARQYPDFLRFAAGIHPHAASQADARALDALRELLADSQAVAVGEIGLDYFRDLSPRQDQRRAFLAQLALAREFHLPAIVHIRDAVEDALSMLAEAALPRRGVWHAFSGDAGLAERALGLGFYLGAAGPITYPRAASLREVFRRAPLDRILLETDAPYLPPQSDRGARNEPALAGEILRRLASERNLAPERMAAATRENANQLFGWE
jgi:TatD DNase family protein